MKGGSLVAPQSQADILKRAVVIVSAGQANVGFLCKADHNGEHRLAVLRAPKMIQTVPSSCTVL